MAWGSPVTGFLWFSVSAVTMYLPRLGRSRSAQDQKSTPAYAIQGDRGAAMVFCTIGNVDLIRIRVGRRSLVDEPVSESPPFDLCPRVVENIFTCVRVSHLRVSHQAMRSGRGLDTTGRRQHIIMLSACVYLTAWINWAAITLIKTLAIHWVGVMWPVIGSRVLWRLLLVLWSNDMPCFLLFMARSCMVRDEDSTVWHCDTSTRTIAAEEASW
jgi:hypothetical protein